MEENGLRVSGVDATGEPRAMELERHPFFVATLYVPQLTSSTEVPHPLFRAFLGAAAGASDGLRAHPRS
jgi:CTP synthase (UTP-ammonia lyase)